MRHLDTALAELASELERLVDEMQADDDQGVLKPERAEQLHELLKGAERLYGKLGER